MSTYVIKWLKDKLGTRFFPVTHINAVRDDTGTSLASMLEAKQDTLVSGTNIKTVNNNSLVGSGNVSIATGDTNVINTVKVNGTALTPDANKAVNITAVTTFNGSSGAVTYTAPVSSVNGQTGAVSISTGDANVIETIKVNNSALTPDSSKAVNISAVTSFNGSTGAVTYTAPVTSVNGETGAVTIAIPSEVTESTVSGWGFTKNAGTITGITMNGSSKGTSGVVNLGTVITSHQDISGKADKSTTTTAGTYKSVTVNSSGIVTGGSNPTTIEGYGITDAYTKTETDEIVDDYLPLSGGNMTGDITFASNTGFYAKDTGGTSRLAMKLDGTDNLLIGYGTAVGGSNTYIDGNNLYIRYGTSQTTGIFLNSSGNVGIGTSLPSYKLHVNGQLGVTTASQGTMRFVSDSSTNYIQSGNAAFNGNADMKISGYNATQGTNLDLNFSVVKATNNLKVKSILYMNYGAEGMYLTDSGINWHNSNDTWAKSVVKITSAGYVGIGTSSPSAMLHVGGVVKCTSVDTSSDERMKNKVGDITIKVEDIANAPNVTFKWKEGEDKENIHGGTYAQYWEKITPYYVHGDGEKSMDYASLSLSCAIELAKEVVQLKEENAMLKQELADIKEILKRVL